MPLPKAASEGQRAAGQGGSTGPGPGPAKVGLGGVGRLRLQGPCCAVGTQSPPCLVLMRLPQGGGTEEATETWAKPWGLGHYSGIHGSLRLEGTRIPSTLPCLWQHGLFWSPRPCPGPIFPAASHVTLSLSIHPPAPHFLIWKMGRKVAATSYGWDSPLQTLCRGYPLGGAHPRHRCQTRRLSCGP